MIKFVDDIEFIAGCKVRISKYHVFQKEWRWFEIAQKAGGGVGVNGLMACNFIDGWMFDEILRIQIKEDLRTGLLLSFDEYAYSNMRKGELAKQMKVVIMKGLLLSVFGGELVSDNGREKYFLEGYDVESFFDEWVRRISGTNNGRKYMLKVDDKVRYKELTNEYFESIGFIGGREFSYCGIYDCVEKKVEFSAWRNTGFTTRERPTNSRLEFFDSGKSFWDGVWMCKFDGTLEEFENLCYLLGY